MPIEHYLPCKRKLTNTHITKLEELKDEDLKKSSRNLGLGINYNYIKEIQYNKEGKKIKSYK